MKVIISILLKTFTKLLAIVLRTLISITSLLPVEYLINRSKSVVFVLRMKMSQLQHNKRSWGGSPGLVVMGGDSCSKGCEFESRHHILDGHFFTYIFVVKICNVCLKRRKYIKKRPGLAHLKKLCFN